MNITVPSTAVGLEEAQDAIRRLVEADGRLGEVRRMAILTATQEALGNAIVHGNKDKPDARVRVQVDRSDVGVSVTVEDEGQGFDHANTRGLGLRLVKSCASSVEYNDAGNQLKLFFSFESQASEEHPLIGRGARLRCAFTSDGETTECDADLEMSLHRKKCWLRWKLILRPSNQQVFVIHDEVTLDKQQAREVRSDQAITKCVTLVTEHQWSVEHQLRVFSVSVNDDLGSSDEQHDDDSDFSRIRRGAPGHTLIYTYPPCPQWTIEDLAEACAGAQKEIGIHGVTAYSKELPGNPCTANVAELLQAGFKLHETPLPSQPDHLTIEVPSPVTDQVVEALNTVLGMQEPPR